MDEVRLFILRVWRRFVEHGSSEFRASVRAADEEQAQMFRSADELTRYLDQQSRQDGQEKTDVAKHDKDRR
jgi:hypothetical protein